jgi:hypothetical protein
VLHTQWARARSQAAREKVCIKVLVLELCCCNQGCSCCQLTHQPHRHIHTPAYLLQYDALKVLCVGQSQRTCWCWQSWQDVLSCSS